MLTGTHSRRARRGKPGHDAPYLLSVGSADLGFGRGEAWAVHLAWSGDAEYFVEHLPEGAGAFSSALGAGEALRPGEVILADGDRYEAPTALFVWSDGGLDGIADRLHRRLRARASHPSSPRPLTLNTWEAVYFDHDLDRWPRSWSGRIGSASSAWCSTTAGSMDVGTIAQGSATGSWTAGSRPMGSARSPTSSTRVACSSDCGSSRR